MELDAQVNRHNNRDKVLLFLGVYSVLNVDTVEKPELQTKIKLATF